MHCDPLKVKVVGTTSRSAFCPAFPGAFLDPSSADESSHLRYPGIAAIAAGRYRLPRIPAPLPFGIRPNSGGVWMVALDLPALRAAEVVQAPFPYLIVPGFVRPEARAAINAHFPKIDRPG